MMNTMPIMANKPKKDRTSDRHKPGRMVRVRKALADPAQEAADALATDLTEYVNMAIREKLEREGRWPIKS